MKKLFKLLSLVVAVGVSTNAVADNHSTAKVGDVAPDFTFNAGDEQMKISDFKGKNIVLEWTNHECPFVKKHYDDGDMQALQAKYRAQDVVWVSINSSAEGKQGHLATDADAMKIATEKNAKPNYIVRDADGKIGHMYGASTTPHMFVIDKEGKLAYAGAIDSIASASKDDVAKADNYVAAALDELIAGKPVTKAVSTPYGCGVKY